MSLQRLSIVLFCLVAMSACQAPSSENNAIQQTPMLGMTVTTTDPATLLVDRADDDPFGDFTCLSEVENDCTLRGAIMHANGNPEKTAILFASDYRIVLQRPLPPIMADNLLIQAQPNQEVHVNGAGVAGNVFQIQGSETAVSGLRIYGSGTGFSNIWIGGAASHVTIANNIIGDDDAPMADCGLSDQSYGGIYIDAKSSESGQTQVWIFNNIIECHKGLPGDGITIATSGVLVGENRQGEAANSQKNEIRANNGFAVRLGNHGGNTIQNTIIAGNGGTFLVENFSNNIMYNTIR